MSMLVAVFNQTTGWSGKTITYEEVQRQFILQDHGPITAQNVLDYDAQGQVEWAREGLCEWARDFAGWERTSRPETQAASQPSSEFTDAPPAESAVSEAEHGSPTSGETPASPAAARPAPVTAESASSVGEGDAHTEQPIESYEVIYRSGLPAYPNTKVRSIELRVLDDRLELPAQKWFPGLTIPYSAARGFSVTRKPGMRPVISISYEDETGENIRLELMTTGMSPFPRRQIEEGKQIAALLRTHMAEGLAPVLTGDAAMICPHCQTKGSVTTKSVRSKKGISGGKATGALLTGGLSILATGLSRKESSTEAHCSVCGATWYI
ncbi:MAG: hypothetical protein ACLQUT_00730 [Thermoleophilia bacterium]